MSIEVGSILLPSLSAKLWMYSIPLHRDDFPVFQSAGHVLATEFLWRAHAGKICSTLTKVYLGAGRRKAILPPPLHHERRTSPSFPSQQPNKLSILQRLSLTFDPLVECWCAANLFIFWISSMIIPLCEIIFRGSSLFKALIRIRAGIRVRRGKGRSWDRLIRFERFWFISPSPNFIKLINLRDLILLIKG